MDSFRKYTFLYHWQQHSIIPRNQPNAGNGWIVGGRGGVERFLIKNSEILKAIQEVTVH